MLAEAMAANSGRSKTAAEQFVRTFFTLLKEALQRDNIVKIKGFGTFKLVVVAARESVNVNNGERVSIAEYNKITFTPDKKLKDRINRPFAQFETINLDTEEEFEIADAFVATQPEVATPSSEVVSPAEESTTAAEESITPAAAPVSPASESENSEHENAVPAQAYADNESLASAPLSAPAASIINATTINADTINVTRLNHAEPLAPASEAASSACIDDEDMEPTPSPKRRALRYILLILLALILMAAAYIAGYHRVLPSAVLPSDSPRVSAAVADTALVTIASSECDTVVASTAALDTATALSSRSEAEAEAPESVPQPTMAELRAEAEKYPQLEGGRYLMVGIKTTRKVVWGSNLIRFCRQIYGKWEVYTYVVKFNGFPDPNNIPIGTVIKFPELIPR